MSLINIIHNIATNKTNIEISYDVKTYIRFYFTDGTNIISSFNKLCFGFKIKDQNSRIVLEDSVPKHYMITNSTLLTEVQYLNNVSYLHQFDCEGLIYTYPYTLNIWIKYGDLSFEENYNLIIDFP